MNPGTFDRKIEIKQPAQGKTSMGARDVSYTTVATVWAVRRAETLTEGVVNRRLTVTGRYRYGLHALSYIDESYRITDAGVDYNIVAVDPQPGGVFMYVTAEKIPA